MNLQLLANSNIKLPEHLSHIKMDYGYSYYNDSVTNLTTKNSFTVRQLLIIDSLLNRINPIGDVEKKVVEEVAEKSFFLDNDLPEDFSKNLKIQINVNTGLNNKFKNLATSILNADHPITLGVTSHLSFMYPNTQQVVIGTKEFNIKSEDFEKGLGVFNYAYRRQSSLEKGVTFTLFHEVAHTLENYYNKVHGSLDDKIHHIQPVLNYLIQNMEFNKNNPDAELLTPRDYNLDGVVMESLQVLYGEIYADCGAILLQRNYEIKNGTYNEQDFDKYININTISRECEKIAFKDTCKFKVIIVDHYTVPGVEFLREELKLYAAEKITDQTMHSLCQQAVTHGIIQTLKGVINENPDYKKQFELLFNMSLVNEEIKIAKKIIPIENYLDDNIEVSTKIKMKA